MKTIAHVGHDKSSGDRLRTSEVHAWLTGRGHTYPGAPDYINLNDGRDFLAERKQYDVVVLHFLFRGGFGAGYKEAGELAISPLAGWAEWRRALVATGAKWIFAYGGLAEVGGTYLVNLPGYTVHKIRTETISTRMNDSQTEGQGLWIFERTDKS